MMRAGIGRDHWTVADMGTSALGVGKTIALTVRHGLWFMVKFHWVKLYATDATTLDA